MKNLLSLILVSGILLATGCAHPSASSAKAAKIAAESSAGMAETMPAATNGKAVIYVFLDRGIADGMAGFEATQRKQVGDFMVQDLVGTLGKAGYAAKVIEKPADYTAAPDRYLLSVKIVRYNPGAPGARVVVGYGAGAASLDIHYDLTGASGGTVLSKDDGVGSSRGWRPCCHKLNQNMTQAIKGALGGG